MEGAEDALEFSILWAVWDPVTVTSRASEWYQIPHFYSCVCIYKYICVFIFGIEHTHIISTPNCACVKHALCALVGTHSSAVVCCTLEKKRCTVHFFPYMNLIGNKRFKGINI